MKQLSLAQGGFEKYAKSSRRAELLVEVDRVVPWQQLCALIEPHYPKAGRGRPPVAAGAHAETASPSALVQRERPGP